MRGNAGHRMSCRMKYWLFERIAKSALGWWVFTIQITDKRALRRFRIHQQHLRRRTSTMEQLGSFINKTQSSSNNLESNVIFFIFKFIFCISLPSPI